MPLQEVAPDYDRSWVPAWAKGLPIYKIGSKGPPYTYADWLSWPILEDKMELLDGLLVAMAFPTAGHAGIETRLAYLIGQYLEDKPGAVFTSNFGVRLFPDSGKEEDKTVISPDITVVLDTSRINDEGLQGAPDFLVEILSPSNKKQDLIVKLAKYKEAGVGEYWIVDPDLHSIQVNLLKDGEYVIKMYDADKDGKVPVKTLPGLVIDFAAVFKYVAEKTGHAAS
jgi:Uma2 family endonuclease